MAIENIQSPMTIIGKRGACNFFGRLSSSFRKGIQKFHHQWKNNVFTKDWKRVLITLHTANCHLRHVDHWMVRKNGFWSQSKKNLIVGWRSKKFGHQQQNLEWGGHVICFWKTFVELHMWQLKATKNFIVNEKKNVLASDKKRF